MRNLHDFHILWIGAIRKFTPSFMNWKNQIYMAIVQLKEKLRAIWHPSYSQEVIKSKSNRPKSDNPRWKDQNSVKCILWTFHKKWYWLIEWSHLGWTKKNDHKCPKETTFFYTSWNFIRKWSGPCPKLQIWNKYKENIVL